MRDVLVGVSVAAALLVSGFVVGFTVGRGDCDKCNCGLNDVGLPPIPSAVVECPPCTPCDCCEQSHLSNLQVSPAPACDAPEPSEPQEACTVEEPAPAPVAPPSQCVPRRSPLRLLRGCGRIPSA